MFVLFKPTKVKVLLQQTHEKERLMKDVGRYNQSAIILGTLADIYICLYAHKDSIVKTTRQDPNRGTDGN